MLEEICDGDEMHLELMAKLLDTERQFKKKTRRLGFYESLEKYFDTISHSPEEAIKNAHLRRDLRQAALEGDVATISENVKQLSLGDAPEKEESKPQTWANFKYAKKEE